MDINHSQYKQDWSRTRLYKIWCAMRARCMNVKRDCYPQYGGRGITVDKDWYSFESFRDWSLANGYSAELSIDRIDTDGNYSPSNCRWADDATQMRNRRCVKLSMEDARIIRKRAANGDTRRDIAKTFGITAETVGKIVRGLRWADG